MKFFQTLTTESTSVVTSSVTTTASDVTNSGSIAVASVITVDTNAAGTYNASSLTANQLTVTAHGWKTGVKGQMTTANTLPTGLATSTDYFVIVVNANTVKFATSYANAIAGTAISLSGGVSTSVFTPTSLAGGTVQAQWSNTNVSTDWINIGSATSITTSVNFGVTVDRPAYKYLRLTFTITAGSLTAATTSVINQDL